MIASRIALDARGRVGEARLVGLGVRRDRQLVGQVVHAVGARAQLGRLPAPGLGLSAGACSRAIAVGRAALEARARRRVVVFRQQRGMALRSRGRLVVFGQRIARVRAGSAGCAEIASGRCCRCSRRAASGSMRSSTVVARGSMSRIVLAIATARAMKPCSAYRSAAKRVRLDRLLVAALLAVKLAALVRPARHLGLGLDQLAEQRRSRRVPSLGERRFELLAQLADGFVFRHALRSWRSDGDGQRGAQPTSISAPDCCIP